MHTNSSRDHAAVCAFYMCHIELKATNMFKSRTVALFALYLLFTFEFYKTFQWLV